MKSNNFNIRIILSLLLFAFVLQSCFTTYYGKILSEHDEVKSTERFKLIFFYDDDIENNTSLSSVEQTILKEIDSKNISTYTIYEKISLYSDAFKLKDEMYIIIDTVVFPHKINNAESERYITISENTSSILTSDSTDVNVVTGYNTNENIRIKHFYTLDSSLIEAIKNAKNISFRYYSGPHKMTVSMDYYDLEKFKELINMPKEDSP